MPETYKNNLARPDLTPRFNGANFCKTHERIYVRLCMRCEAEKPKVVNIPPAKKWTFAVPNFRSDFGKDELTLALLECEKIKKLKGRKAEVVVQRVRMAKTLFFTFGMSYSNIARLLGLKDHTSVIWYIKKYSEFNKRWGRPKTK